MILVDQTAVPLAVPELIRDLGGNLDEGPWILALGLGHLDREANDRASRPERRRRGT